MGLLDKLKGLIGGEDKKERQLQEIYLSMIPSTGELRVSTPEKRARDQNYKHRDPVNVATEMAVLYPDGVLVSDIGSFLARISRKNYDKLRAVYQLRTHKPFNITPEAWIRLNTRESAIDRAE